jgi:cyclophilin family peptidyl-prolyl cis-trans isomerase
MAVLIETSKGDLVIDLFVDECPIASKNFLKLCKCVCLAVKTRSSPAQAF